MHHEIFECKTYLGMFGAKTWKPVLLVSSDPCVQQLARPAHANGKGMPTKGLQIDLVKNSDIHLYAVCIYIYIDMFPVKQNMHAIYKYKYISTLSLAGG